MLADLEKHWKVLKIIEKTSKIKQMGRLADLEDHWKSNENHGKSLKKQANVEAC